MAGGEADDNSHFVDPAETSAIGPAVSSARASTEATSSAKGARPPRPALASRAGRRGDQNRWLV